jgi:predicted alpha/beta-hydrolase family hydrolase
VERRAIPVRAASEELLLDCGDGVVLQAFHSSPAKRGREPGKRLAVLLHGWEGSADSTYVLSASQTLFDLGFEVVRLNLRDHGATHHLNRELFHSCRLPEVVGAVRALAGRFPGMPIVLGGFSLGGNFMLRVAADREARDLPLQHVVASLSGARSGRDDDDTRARLADLSRLLRAQMDTVAREEAAGVAGSLRLRRAAAHPQPSRDDSPARAEAHRNIPAWMPISPATRSRAIG